MIIKGINIKQLKPVQRFDAIWIKFKAKHPEIARFFTFFMVGNVVTLLQILLMPIFKAIFNMTSLADIGFQAGRMGTNFDGSAYFMFNYAAGSLSAGGGGGLAYFLAVQTTLAVAQVINFFGQRNITFKSNGNIWWAAMWYVLTYVVITLLAAALQGLYKAPVYGLFIDKWGLGGKGETMADVVTMLITCAISFWVYYPVLKIIFKSDTGKLSKIK
jgi:hypothetical protein